MNTLKISKNFLFIWKRRIIFVENKLRALAKLVKAPLSRFLKRKLAANKKWICNPEMVVRIHHARLAYVKNG